MTPPLMAWLSIRASLWGRAVGSAEWRGARLGRVLAFAAAVFLLFGGASPGASLSPTETVKTTIDEVFRILSDEKMKQPEQLAARRKLLEQVIGSRFDYKEMSKRSLAAHWRNLTEAEQTEFVALFKAFLSDSYAGKIEAYSGEDVQYLNERRKDGFAEVQTKIVSTKVDFPMDYRLLNKSGGWFVYDVVVDGISLVKNYRSQFKKIIRTSSYEDLVEKLRKRVESLNTAEP